MQNCNTFTYSTSVKQNERTNRYDPQCSQHCFHYGTWDILINSADWPSEVEHCLTNKHRTAHSISILSCALILTTSRFPLPPRKSTNGCQLIQAQISSLIKLFNCHLIHTPILKKNPPHCLPWRTGSKKQSCISFKLLYKFFCSLGTPNQKWELKSGDA